MMTVYTAYPSSLFPTPKFVLIYVRRRKVAALKLKYLLVSC